VRFPLWRRKRDEQLDDEIQSHLKMAKRDRIERGEAPEEAERTARRELGNETLVKETTRDTWGWMWLEVLFQDIRYGLRMLRKSPGFTIVAVLTLALGIGANTALFSVVNGVLLNPLPYPEPDQLVLLHASKPNFPNGSISYPNFLDWQKDNQSFSGMAVVRGYSFSLTGMGEAEQLRARFVSSDFFSILGVKPALGRTFVAGEDEFGAAPIALISAGIWSRKFGSSPDVLGKSITLDGRSYAIVGVIPGSFSLSLLSSRAPDVYVPIGQWTNPSVHNRSAGLAIHGIGRLKPGVTIAQARADMQRVTDNLARAYPNVNKAIGASVHSMKEELLGDVRSFLIVLLAAVGFVLMIACVNVANLLLARTTARSREFAIRASLGAGRARLIRQLLTESTLLALAGGGLGLLLASWSIQAALGVLPSDLPRAGEIHVDTRVLLFTLAISVFAGILFGLAPALRTFQRELQEVLKQGGRGSTGARHRAQGIFVVVEMALALVLLIGAGLMIRTLSHLWRVNPGFQPDHVLSFGISLPPSMQKAPAGAIRAALRDAEARIAATPGVQSVSLSSGSLPLSGEDDGPFYMADQPKPKNLSEMNSALYYVVEPDYLKVMQIPLKSGWFFTPRDDERAPLIAVVDDVLARQYFGKGNPIGKRIVTQNSDQPVEIIGVVGHIKQWGLDTDDDPQQLRAQLYTPFMQSDDGVMALSTTGTGVVVRSTGADPQLFDSLRRALQASNPKLVTYGAQTMNEIIAASLAARSFSMILLSIFAALALLLSSIGIYGVISYLVGQRTHEIGIRLALGAQRLDVLRLVLGQGTKLALLGIVIGLVSALGLTRLMHTLLYGVSATDPLTFGGVAVLLTGVALLACYIPARRAMRVDPVVALRHE
jgi:predicted permease